MVRTARAVSRPAQGPARVAVAPRRPPAPARADTERSAAERVCLLREQLAQLPPEQGRAVRAYLAGLSVAETATLYGWSAAVARHRLYRGLQALQTRGRQGAP
jgi:DNA-directed RNA polymerase specialized sigma24 family protein